MTPLDAVAMVTRRRSILIASLFVLMLGLQMPAWSALLRHNLARAELVVAQEPEQMNALVLSADFLEYRDYFREFPTKLADLHGNRIDIEYYKRPLYGPVSGFLSVAVSSIIGEGYPRTMYVILSFYASLAVTLLGLLAVRLGLTGSEALLTGAMGAFSFSWLSIFSLPESYSLSVCAALLALHTGHSLSGRRDTRITAPVVRHLVVTALASWIYLPLCGAVLMMLDGVHGKRQWLTVIAPCVCLAALAAALPHLIRGSDDIALQVNYASRWSAASHLLDPGLLVRVGSAFLWFGVIAPVGDFVRSAPSVDIVAILHRWPSTCGVIVLSATYGWLATGTRKPNAHRVQGATLWFISFYLFHVFFNPGEVLLYLSVPTAVLLYLMTVAVGNRAGRGPRARQQRFLVTAAMLLIAASLAVCNLPTALGL